MSYVGATATQVAVANTLCTCVESAIDTTGLNCDDMPDFEMGNLNNYRGALCWLVVLEEPEESPPPQPSWPLQTLPPDYTNSLLHLCGTQINPHSVFV